MCENVTVVDADFARELERELAAMRAERDALKRRVKELDGSNDITEIKI